MDHQLKNKVEGAINACLKSKSGKKPFAVSLKLDEKVFQNNCINFKDVGNIPVPVTLDNMRKLATFSKTKTSAANVALEFEKDVESWQINGCDFLLEDAGKSEFVNNTVPMLAKKVLLLMGLDPTKIEVNFVLQYLIVCKTGSCIKFPYIPNNDGFIKIILQIPVEGGHEGGRIKVELQNQIQLFNLSKDSERFYHLTAFYSDCQHILEEVTFGWRLALVFNLVIEAPKSPISKSPEPDLETFLAISNLQQIFSRIDQQLNFEPPLLALLLEHRYSSSGLNFLELRGRDRDLVELLSYVDSIDLHLAIIQKYESGLVQEEDGIYDSESCTCCVTKGCHCQKSCLDEMTMVDVLEEDLKILNWIGVDGQTVSCTSLEVNSYRQLIMFDRKIFCKPDQKKVFVTIEDDCIESSLTCLYNAPVLLIWPKSKTLEMNLRGNFMTTLDRIEENLNVEELRRVITFCNQHQFVVWNESADRKERTLRLVRLCLRLKAKTEGLKLLKILADDFHRPGIVSFSNIRYEGVRSNAIAIKIAKLIKLIGWSVCCKVVERLVDISRAAEQLEHFAQLSTALLDLDCTDGGKIIGHLVCSFLFSTVHNLISRLTPSAIVACTSMIFRMQQLEGAGPFRIHCYQMLLHSQPLSKLFPIIEGISKVCKETTNLVCQNFQQELHRHLANCHVTEELAVDVMVFFLLLDDAILLKDFTRKLLCRKDADVLRVLVSSPDIWNLCLLSLDGRWALRLLVDTYIEHLEQITFPDFTWVQDTDALIDKEVVDFLRSRSFKHVFNFNCRNQAEEWMKKNFETSLDSISVDVVMVEGDSKVCCIVTKTKQFYNLKVESFYRIRLELNSLRDRRRRRLDENNVANLFGFTQIKKSKRIRIDCNRTQT